jgi:hypothetical protein
MVKPSYIEMERRGFHNPFSQEHLYLSAVGMLGGGN